MRAPSSLYIWSIAALGALVLPWHMQQDGVALGGLMALGQADPEAASALWQAIAHKRFWFWPVVAALALALPGALPFGTAARRAGFLLAGAGFGLAAIVAQGLAIGVQGWSTPWLVAMFGELDDRQFGVGLGGTLAFAGFVLLLTDGLALRGFFRGDRFVSGAVGVLVASIILFTAWPVGTVLSQMFTPRGDLSTAAALADRLFDQKIWGLSCVAANVNCGVFWNTLLLATSTASAATLLGLCFALIVTRTAFPLRRGLRLLTVLPIITPPFVIGLGLILIFGRSGVVNQLVEAMFGVELGRWIYGFNGVFLAQVFSFTPTAFLVLIGVVEGISPTMEEASQTLRASRMRTFSSVTLPLMLPGLANAWLVVFVESLADFGNPIVLGGSFGVLSTEIFFAVVGAQQDFGRAAVLAAVMLVVALVAFMIQRLVVGTRSYVSMTGKGDAGLPQPLPRRVKVVAFAVAIPWAVLTIVVYTMALAGAFVRVWGRDWTPTLSHFQRAFALEWAPSGGLIFAGGAWHSLFTTIQLAAIRPDHGGDRAARRLGVDAPALRRAHGARVRADADLRRAGHGDRRRLHPDLQHPAARDHWDGDHPCRLLRLPQPAGRRAVGRGGHEPARQVARRGGGDAARLDLPCHPHGGGAAAAQARHRHRAGLFLRARHDDGLGRHLPGLGGIRDGDGLHHQPRHQRRLRPGHRLLRGADRADDGGDRADQPSRGPA